MDTETVQNFAVRFTRNQLISKAINSHFGRTPCSLSVNTIINLVNSRKCLDSFSEIRRKVLVQDFLEALTQGENNLSARAIEIQAHDPLRYLGDILAWTHQAVAGEKEILNLIFGVAASSRSSDFEPGSERWLEDGTILSALEDLVEKDLEGTIRPIRVSTYLISFLIIVAN